MKFAHQLKFNSVPEWKEHYLHYAALKKIIYQIAKAEGPGGWKAEDGENLSSLLLPTPQPPVEDQEKRLAALLEKDLIQISQFFGVEEARLAQLLGALEQSIREIEQGLGIGEGGGGGGSSSGSRGGATVGMTDRGSRAEADAEEQGGTGAGKGQQKLSRASRVEFWADSSRPAPQGWLARSHKQAVRARGKALAELRPRFKELFVGLHDLLEYWQINHEGFRKVLKKHDKVTSSITLKETFWPVVERDYPHTSRKSDLEKSLDQVADQYAVLYLAGDQNKAQSELNGLLREEITVERSTVWRDMMAMERRQVSAQVKSEISGRRPWHKVFHQPVCLTVILLIFFTLLWVGVYPTGPDPLSLEGQQATAKNNCLALLVLASMLWATEALPLYTTAMLVPALVVVLRLLCAPGGGENLPLEQQWHRLSPEKAAATIFHNMFSQVIMLLLGGFAIAGALSKHAIAKQMAVAVLSRVGRRPEVVLLACMFVATFASMWISNVAAPVLCFSLVQPILRTLDTGHPFSKSLVMGIALASNIGGMTSPISSPQNIFAIDEMKAGGVEPTWLQWFAIALPVAVIGNLACWMIIRLRYSFMPGPKITEVRPLKPNTDPISSTQVYVIAVSMLTVGLWCANKQLSQWTGEMGVLAVVPLVAFFGFGILNKDDFNGFLWNVVMLAMGGSALGEAVKSSGLLDEIARDIKEQVTTAQLSLFYINIVFCAMVLVSTTFISHTVGAFVILPIVREVGERIVGPDGRTHQGMLIMTTALMCSGAMGLPVSGFPNMNAVSLEDPTGQNYVNTGDFLSVGVPSSLVAYLLVVTVGYKLGMLLGF